MRRGEAGFSLIEALIALTILALMAGIAGPRLYALLDRGKARIAEIEMGQIAAALELYRLDMGAYPAPEQGLAALLERPPSAEAAARWSGPYLDGGGDGLLDPWSAPYRYARPGPGGRPFALTSYGADGAPGGAGENADLGAD
jgi:general secretion pathway protein G